MGKKEDAIVRFRGALRLKPDDTLARENLRVALILQKKSG
jgi:Flp pilus assembly protein TadD